MTFISIFYGFFLLSLLGIYWTAQQQRSRLWLLLIASLIFYASLQPKYIPLLLFSILINYSLGQVLGWSNSLRVAKKPGKKPEKKPGFSEKSLSPHQTLHRNPVFELSPLQTLHRNPVSGFLVSVEFLLLWIGIGLNVLLLFGFKYMAFFFTIAEGLFNWPMAGEIATWYSANITPPLGISFFSFECIAYLVDVYRGAPPSRSLLRFTTYKFFFPKLISGPITRYHNFVRQLKTPRFPGYHQAIEGLWLIACGAIKKGLVADRLGSFVDITFENLQRAGSGDLWLAIFAYGFQLYLDFSGYVDLARGTALLLGFNLPENFDFPYFTTSIAEFWRRWHISLGDWLRNYLYFPLGGSRKGLIRTCFNLLIVMLIAGIWHGAAWGFILWGGLHGLALVIHRLTDTISDRIGVLKAWWNSIPGVVMAWGLTQSMVFMSWVVFRLPILKDSGWVFTHLWGMSADIQFTQKVYGETLGIQRLDLAFVLAGIGIVMALSYALYKQVKVQLNWPVKILLVPVLLYVAWLFAPETGQSYIYFDF